MTDEIVFEAARLRLKHRRLSYADCIGYVTARHEGVKFLTGDRVFERMENVEFVR